MRQWGGYFYYDDSYPNEDCKVWAPSTYIAHAWEVVSDLFARGWSVRIQTDSPGFYHVQIITNDKLPQIFQAKGASVASAICLAALKAVGALYD